MPLMVNPSSGSRLYGQNPSILTFVASTTPPSVAGSTVSTLIQAIASASATGTAVATISAPSGKNMTLVLGDDAAEQTGMDNSTPRNLMLAFGILLLLCMLISHPRFLARLFASLPASQRTTIRRKPSAYPFDAANLKVIGDEKEQRVAGGGGLSEGWFLREGEKRTNLLSPSPFTEKDNPYPSPFDELSLHAPSTPTPHLYPPPHITPLLSHLPLSSTLLLAPFSRFPDLFRSSATLVQIYLVIAYLFLVALALIWKSDITPKTNDQGYGADFVRSGLVALSQIPLVVALGVRGNLIGLCVGKGYERLKVFHKIVGRVVFVAATLHVAFFIQKWAIAGIFRQYSSKQFIICGYVAWGSIVLIAVSSVPWIRKAWYGVFEICHFVGMIGLLAGMCFHVGVAVPFCISALLIYMLSLVGSLTKTRLAHAELVALPGASTTLITIPSLRSGWRAGQHVRLRVTALGFPLGTEAHPFTIASAPDGDGMVLMCKAAGTWTEKLYELAAGREETLQTGDPGTKRTTTATVILEGPYGGLGHTLLPSFSSVVLVAGGSGITHSLALAHDLVTRAPTGVVRARTVDLVWIVRTEDLAKPLVPSLLELVSDAKAWEVQCLQTRLKGGDRPQPTALRVTVYITRCPASSPVNLLAQDAPFLAGRDDVLLDRQRPRNPYGLGRQTTEADQQKYAYLCRNVSTSSSTSSLMKKHNTPLSTISVHASRPEFGSLLTDFVDETIARSGRDMVNASGVCVTPCGPVGMCDDVRRAVRGLEGWKKRVVGGVELEEERFGF